MNNVKTIPVKEEEFCEKCPNFEPELICFHQHNVGKKTIEARIEIQCEHLSFCFQQYEHFKSLIREEIEQERLEDECVGDWVNETLKEGN